MSLNSDLRYQCRRHPPQSRGAGICAECLTERLAELVCAHCAKLGSYHIGSSCCLCGPAGYVSKWPRQDVINVGSIGRISSLIEIDMRCRKPLIKIETRINGNVSDSKAKASLVLQQSKPVRAENASKLSNHNDQEPKSLPEHVDKAEKPAVLDLFNRNCPLNGEDSSSEKTLNESKTVVACRTMSSASRGLKQSPTLSVDGENIQHNEIARQEIDKVQSPTQQTVAAFQSPIVKKDAAASSSAAANVKAEQKRKENSSCVKIPVVAYFSSRSKCAVGSRNGSSNSKYCPSCGKLRSEKATASLGKLTRLISFGRSRTSRAVAFSTVRGQPDCDCQLGPKMRSRLDLPDSMNTRVKMQGSVQSKWAFLGSRDADDASVNIPDTPAVYLEFDDLGDFQNSVQSSPCPQTISSLISMDFQYRETFPRSQSESRPWNISMLSPVRIFRHVQYHEQERKNKKKYSEQHTHFLLCSRN